MNDTIQFETDDEARRASNLPETIELFGFPAHVTEDQQYQFGLEVGPYVLIVTLDAEYLNIHTSQHHKSGIPFELDVTIKFPDVCHPWNRSLSEVETYELTARAHLRSFGDVGLIVLRALTNPHAYPELDNPLDDEPRSTEPADDPDDEDESCAHDGGTAGGVCRLCGDET